MQRGTPLAAVDFRTRPQSTHFPFQIRRLRKTAEQLQRIFAQTVFAVIEQHPVQTLMHTLKTVGFAGKAVAQKDMTRILIMAFERIPCTGKSIHLFSLIFQNRIKM